MYDLSPLLYVIFILLRNTWCFFYFSFGDRLCRPPNEELTPGSFCQHSLKLTVVADDDSRREDPFYVAIDILC